MTFIVARDIPLSTQTREAWKSQGGLVTRMARGEAFIERYLERHPDTEFVLNMGSTISSHSIGNSPVVNPSGTVAALWSPGSTRRAFGDLLPPRPEHGALDYWLKNTGRGGRGKIRSTEPFHGQAAEDVQKHIEGQEYRIITVGHRIVQQFLRFGENGNRTYRQLPLDEVPSAIIGLVRRATAQLDPILTLVAWDTIHDGHFDKAYLLEGNTCPGVKDYTARRIVNAIKEHINASI